MFHVAARIGLGHASAEGIGTSFAARVDLAEPERAEILAILVLEGEDRRRFLGLGVCRVRIEETEATVLGAADRDGLDDIEIPDLAEQTDDGIDIGRVSLALGDFPACRALGQGERGVLRLDDDLGNFIDREFLEDLLLVC